MKIIKVAKKVKASKLISLAGMAEMQDQMKAELTKILTEASHNLSKADENFLLNKVGDIHGEDKQRGIDRLFSDENNLSKYESIKILVMSQIFKKVLKVVSKYKMAFRSEVEMLSYVDVFKTILQDEMEMAFGVVDNSYESNRGYGNVLFGAEEFGGSKPMSLDSSIYYLLETIEDSADYNTELDQRRSLIKNFIGKTVYLALVEHDGKQYFNKSGTLKALNGERASVDVNLNGEIVNTDVRADRVRFNSF